MKIPVVNQQGEKTEQIELNPRIFEVKINPALIAQAIRVRLANRRLGTHKTKSRGEVRGGGRKPWRQKGTGRARHGSIRSPIWVGGGHAKAKQPRDYSLKFPRKMKRAALFSSLSAQAKNDNIVVVNKITLKEINTKKANEVLEILARQEKGLIILPAKDRVLEKSFKNIPTVRTMEARLLNTSDVLNCQKLIIIKDSLKVIEETFLKS
ncbi:50S ribosomal protein L4 [Patescibacteria group bacterium]|nr:50S ribosomal protein L4 [Patescibacteria group bacterium]MBU1867885.1 50S ribosomal protein L4 [Patescibacteria group bacterium]